MDKLLLSKNTSGTGQSADNRSRIISQLEPTRDYPDFPPPASAMLPRKSEGPVSFLPALSIALYSRRNFGAGEG
ncbi:MAG: hypothetical protein WCJ64_10360, partial [Rhodospirillaceae bacterium]